MLIGLLVVSECVELGHLNSKHTNTVFNMAKNDDSRAARYRLSMKEKGYVARSFWLDNDAVQALDALRERLASEGMNKDSIVSTSIRTLEALTPEEYRLLMERLDKD